MNSGQENTYLSPGFLVTLSEVRNVVRFPLLRDRLRRASPARLALVDALSTGVEENLQVCIQQVCDQYNVPPNHLKVLMERLREGGLVSNAPAEPVFNETSGSNRAQVQGEVAIATPVTLVVDSGEYLWYDHPGELLLKLNLAELLAAATLAQPIEIDAAWQVYQQQDYSQPLDRAQFDDLVARLAGAGLLIRRSNADDLDDTPLYGTVEPQSVQAMVDARLMAHDEAVARSGKDLTPVVPVNTLAGMAPQSLGMIVAYAMEYENRRLQERYDFVPMFLTDEARLLERAATPGIFLFSNYIWNVDDHLRLSAAVKAANPANITIHGGPSTPKYEADALAFFAENTHVDIAVLGEGELTFADLLDKLDPNNPADLTVLRDCPGLNFRGPAGMENTGERERITDVNTIPSPLLMGLFDEFGSAKAAAIIETNRGCPYGCTFCDWGSATLSKVRRFDLDRVYAELEWCAKHQIEDASIADANFGMLDRDVDITRKIAELKREYSYPRTVSINYAKNQVRYLREIIEIMSEVDILAEGVVSLQSMDETTLKVIDRSNIKIDKYNELATEFRKARLPLAADIMMGLPGSTPEAFRDDLQKCTDRDIRVRANPTQLLPNSPMNDPVYRQEHGIVAEPGEILKQTASYTREEWDEMDDLRLTYYLLDSYGILRYIARYVRGETGIGEVEFYDLLRSEASRNPGQWPVISKTLKMLDGYMAPPGSWGLFIREIGRFLVEYLSMEEGSAMRTALAVQQAHLPAPGRQFPENIELEHDFTAWQEALLSAREEGHRDDWHSHVPSLSSFGPATLTISDPNLICRRDVGKPKYILDYNLRTWELESPIARPRLRTTTN